MLKLQQKIDAQRELKAATTAMTIARKFFHENTDNYGIEVAEMFISVTEEKHSAIVSRMKKAGMLKSYLVTQ